uniref:Fibroblast growth factor 23 n=1 Tax=Paramormyrops kingsleyae TaxID=1676925 RepID=A0A3B3TBE1_9TELE|nr:fibroblast growth factor 23 [Paramormyrops kingsleyae]
MHRSFLAYFLNSPHLHICFGGEGAVKDVSKEWHPAALNSRTQALGTSEQSPAATWTGLDQPLEKSRFNSLSCPSSLAMHPSLITLCLAALTSFTLVLSMPNPSPLLGSNWGSPKRYVHLQTSSDINNFYLEISLSGKVRKTTRRTSYSVILLKSEARDRIAIFGVKSNRYLCMDVDGNPFTSTVCNRDECLFHHKLLENHRDVYYSCRNSMLLNLEGARQPFVEGHNLPASSLFLSERNTVPLERLLRRERRNRQVDLSDPLRMHPQPWEGSDSMQYPDLDLDLDQDQDQDVELPELGRAVSRETVISSFYDDPLQVHSKHLNSPRNMG